MPNTTFIRADNNTTQEVRVRSTVTPTFDMHTSVVTPMEVRSQGQQQPVRTSYRQILSLYSKENDMVETSEMVAQRKCEFLSVKIDDALVKYGVSELMHSLIGKLSLAPGDLPYTLDNLYSKLS